MSNIITLTTDFGNEDHYTGAMKGAILRINPKVQLVDISHQIPTFDVNIGAYVIGSSFFAYPRGTIHVVVVDPGVGSERKPILLCTENYFFIAPDNGVLSLVAERDGARAAYHLDKPKYYLDRLSATFHARDIFGPVAAHLAAGANPTLLGTKVDDFEKLNLFKISRKANVLSAKVIHVDRFGNVTVGMTFEHFRHFIKNNEFELKLKGQVFNELKETYSDVAPGENLFLVGSSGFLEVAMNQDSFAMLYGVKVGDTIELLI